MGLGFWTPYQMLAWGLIGYISGLVASKMDNIIFRVVFGFIMVFFIERNNENVLLYMLMSAPVRINVSHTKVQITHILSIDN